ncbi:MAG: hypothetical protein KAG66_01010, partial [Methylococcales bacterium]|nr:hypothetical protein [Methylococcales bacterium]
LPSLFLFDIQSHQIEELEKITDKYGGLQSITPMVRAQLSTVNGESFEKGSASGNLTREQENEMRFRNRGFNLTYRSELSESEELVAGREFSEDLSEIAQVSVEQGFAERLGFEIGDLLVFDVHGVPIEAEVVNLRRVRWTSFQPNFFVVFQPGVLEAAPKNFLATLGPLDTEKKVQVQKDVTASLSNISMINVSRVVETLGRIIDQMAFALRALSMLCLIAGLFVIFAITTHQATARKWDVGLLKALGAPWALIRKSFLYQNMVLAFMAGGLGCVVSLALSYVLSLLLFEGVWAVNLKVPLGAWAILMIVIYVITQIAVRGSLRTKASDLLS